MVLQTSLTLHKHQNLLRQRWMMKKPSYRPSAQSISEKENKRKRRRGKRNETLVSLKKMYESIMSLTKYILTNTGLFIHR